MKLVYSYYALDIVHKGHLEMMKNSKAIAGEDGKLIVGILTDEAIMEKKSRPIVSFNERVEQGGGMLSWVISEGMTGEPERMRKQFKEKIFGDIDVGGVDFVRELDEKNLSRSEKRKQMKKFIIGHPVHAGANMLWNFTYYRNYQETGLHT